MTMEDWSKRLDIFLQADDREILKDAGRVTAEIARDHALSEFEKYRIIQDRLFESDFDRYLREMEAAEATMNNKKGQDDRCDRRIFRVSDIFIRILLTDVITSCPGKKKTDIFRSSSEEDRKISV